LADLNLTNNFQKSFTKDDKIDIIIGADIIYWPESLDPLMETLNVI
jgi:Putative methyltransferase.